MKEKLTFELLYDLLAALFSQLPAVFEAFSALPFNVQQIVLCVVIIAAIPIIIGAVDLGEKFIKWWASKH